MFDTNASTRILVEDADIDALSTPLVKVEDGPQLVIEFVPERRRQKIRTAS